MLYSMELPLVGEGSTSAGARAIAQAADEAGFAMIGYTDHPAPSAKWLDAGGHPTIDPFAGLAFVAAVTRRVRLMTYLAVLPYRNPLLLAKSIATVDRLSDGRFTLVAGSGYLRSEFTALGRPFESRNRLFEESISVIRSIFTDESFTFEGDGFAAVGVVERPRPVQIPHPPIWIGGTSRISRRRVARFGDGWSPLFVPAGPARTVRTAPLDTDALLSAAIDDLRALVAAEGRDPSTISVQLDGAVAMEGELVEIVERAGQLSEIGVTHLVVRPPRGSITEVVAAVERFGDEVIGPSRSA
jgi:probable F420-dependent oxidoreductase